MPRVSQEHLLARRRGIVQAAARCLQRRGLEETGMRDLFRAANLSPGAVYRYFSSKEELVAAVAATSPGIVETALAASADGKDAGARLRRLLAAAAAGSPAARLQLELETAALRSPAIATALGKRRRAAREALAEALRGPEGPPRRELVELVMTLCEGLARARLLETDGDLERRVAIAAAALAAALPGGA